MGPPGFEPESLAPKARRIGQATPRALRHKIEIKIKSFLCFLSMKKAVAFIIISMSFLFIYGNAALSFFIQGSIEINESILLFSAFISFITMFLPPLLFIIIYYDAPLSEALNKLYFRKDNILMAFLYGIVTLAAFIISAVVLIYIFHVNTSNPLADEMGKHIDIALLFILPLSAAINEETFFRGFIHMQIEERYGFIIASLISAFLFSMAHLVYGSGIEIIMTFIFGLFLSASIHLSKNIFAPFLAHFLYDFMAFLSLMHF